MNLLHRPRYHFQPLANWMNDPNGLIQWKGRYHLFYQHSPHDPSGGQAMHWGHTVSQDLAHWTHLPIALAPKPGGPDKDGCWTGCAVDDNGTPTLVYTGVRPQVQCLATSSDDLVTWQKHPANPVIESPPEDLDVTGFRDPYVWKEGQTWYTVIGSGIKGVGGAALLYRSPDLIRWDYVQPICVGREAETGHMWECPNFFSLDDRKVLVVSTRRKALYFIGSYASYSYTPEVRGVIDSGGSFYAPQVLIDDRARRIMWGWLWEDRSKEEQLAAGWAGVMSLPRILSIHADGTLAQEPAPELGILRREHHHWEGLELCSDARVLDQVRSDCLEIVATFDPGDARALGLKVRCSPGEEEETLIVYDRANQCMVVDRERSSLSSGVTLDLRQAPLALDEGESLELRVFLDGSVVEVFANRRTCFASRIYPSRADSLGVAFFAQGGTARLRSLDIWEMESIWR